MSVRSVTDLKTPIGDFLDDAGAEGVVLEAEGRGRYAVLPLDDDLLDYLVARNPTFIDTCRQIRERMRAHPGSSYVHMIVNERREAGASLPHTHGQLYALESSTTTGSPEGRTSSDSFSRCASMMMTMPSTDSSLSRAKARGFRATSTIHALV